MIEDKEQKKVYIKNPHRSSGNKPEEVVPEYVRREVKPVEWQNFNDDFKSASASKKMKTKREAVSVAAQSPPPIVGHTEQTVIQTPMLNQDVFAEDILADEIPDPPTRHRRFVVVDEPEIPKEFSRQVLSAEESPAEEPYMEPYDPEKNLDFSGLFGIPDGGYAIFMGNDFICSCRDKSEAEEAVEIMLTTNPPEELIVVKRVNIKVGVNLSE
jgi:hypothetical protein